jgi:hypothetical protein
MQVLEGIFYTNLTEDLTQFIADSAKFNLGLATPPKLDSRHWKSHDCMILDFKDPSYYRLNGSNGKYLYRFQRTPFDDFKKICSEYNLLEKYIKFTYNYRQCKLKDDLNFVFRDNYPMTILFNYKEFTLNEFIEEIMTNYPECYKYDYSQIKPAIAKFNSRQLCE